MTLQIVLSIQSFAPEMYVKTTVSRNGHPGLLVMLTKGTCSSVGTIVPGALGQKNERNESGEKGLQRTHQRTRPKELICSDGLQRVQLMRMKSKLPPVACRRCHVVPVVVFRLGLEEGSEVAFMLS